MKDKSAFASDNNLYQEQQISFADVPNQTKLFIDYQNNAGSVNNYYPSKNKSFTAYSREVLANYETNRNELCDILVAENTQYEVGKETFDNIEKLRNDDCLAVFTGQQAGLFSGSIYSIYKAFSAIKLAEELNKQGIKAVPIFWIASEDHDFDEISKTFFVDKKENLFEIKNLPSQIKEGSPVGFIEIEQNINVSIDEVFANLPETEFTQQIKDQLTDTYKSGETFSTAFGKLLAKLLNKFGLIFVSPMNEDLRKLCSPIYQKAIENSETITERLLERDKKLKAEHYHSQVLAEDDFFPFFYIDNQNKRNALRFDKETSSIRSSDSKYECSKEELIEIAKISPQSLSPNALLRPVVQDYLFPTICYFGGGAEIAYFGQNSVIYETLNRPVTPIRHRASFTIIQGKHRRTLEKYNLALKNLFVGKEQVSAEIIEKYINTETSKIFAETEETIMNQINYLDQHLAQDDPTLADNLANRQQKIIWHIGTMRKKFHQAELLKNEVFERRINSLFTNLLPKDVLQERNMNVLNFLNLYGENFIDWIYNAVDTKEKNHQIIIF